MIVYSLLWWPCLCPLCLFSIQHFWGCWMPVSLATHCGLAHGFWHHYRTWQWCTCVRIKLHCVAGHIGIRHSQKRWTWKRLAWYTQGDPVDWKKKQLIDCCTNTSNLPCWACVFWQGGYPNNPVLLNWQIFGLCVPAFTEGRKGVLGCWRDDYFLFSSRELGF